MLAADVKHSFDTLVGPHTSPAYKTLLEDVAAAEVVDELTVRYRFRKANRELPLRVGVCPCLADSGGGERRRQVL